MAVKAKVDGLVNVSQARGRSFRRGETLSAPVAGASGSHLYYAAVKIGGFKVNLALDTATSATWVQSAGCIYCFNVSVPNFKSSSFIPMAADHPICTASAGLTPHPANNACSYRFMNSEGIYGFDTFTFFTTSDRKQRHVSVPGLAFGVGVINNWIDIFYYDQSGGGNPIGGFLGLGRDQPSSILNQLSVRKFSYCLPKRFGDKALFYIGDSINANYTGPYVQTTPILGSNQNFYYLKLEAISINGTALPIAQEVLSRNGQGIIIDCGSPYSSFVDEAYDMMHQAVKDYFKQIAGELPLARTRSGYNLCYDLKRHKFLGGGRFSMEFQFLGGATLHLDESTTFQEFPDLNEVCFMMIRVQDLGVPNILGAFQQLNKRFVFDVASSMLSFSPDSC
ncbi:PREDICTED: aspartic proteinase nepenthesin-1-like [Fragaria vesca subsp. vesca]|uniref:aspartic proteinase nepenthesin-1-like n=1 Tax=Fragaria vesca subsp. vesca TaxID=101020 RepID=UPI0002C34C62|nr:PREDICTED: aspartic proteinase nepenthesin-1-like [Fragaria vesca subsp. vesca]